MRNILEILKRLSRPRISLRQSIYVSKRISFLLEAGISLPTALSMVARQMGKRGRVLEDISKDISSGHSLSDIVSVVAVFGASAVSLVKIGEGTGMLTESFSAISDDLERRSALLQKVIGAMIYPLCITVGMLALVVVLMVAVFPKMINIFKSLHVALPVSTRILMWSSEKLRSYGLVLAVVLFFGIVSVIIFYRRNKKFCLKVDGYALRVPLLSKIVRNYTLASISNTMGLLMLNGASFLSAIKVAEKTSKNLAYIEALKKISADVSSGVSIGSALKGFSHLFPSEYSDIVEVGEQTGKLAETFSYAHRLYAHDLELLIKNLSSGIEPFLMIIIGLAIGFVALSIVSPMYSITSHLHG